MQLFGGIQFVIPLVPQGRQVVSVVSVTAVGESIILPSPTSGFLQHLHFLSISNNAASANEVIVHSGVGGVAVLRVRIPSGDCRVFAFPAPLRQQAGDSRWTAEPLDAGPDLVFSVIGFLESQ